MNSALKNAAFFSALAVSLMISAAAGCAFAFFLGTPDSSEALLSLTSHPWWFIYGGQNGGPLWTLGAVMLVAPLASIFVLRARALFGRDPSPIAMFFIFYLFTLCLEGLRGASAFLFATDRSVTATAALTRTVYGGRFAGHFALLAAGLYALELKYPKTLVLTSVIIVTSLAIASNLPMDETVFLSPFMYKLGDEWGLWFAENCLGILAAASLAGAAFSKGKKKYYALAGASLAVFLGRQIVSFSGPPGLLAAGLILLIAGITTFLGVLVKIYRGAESA
jgi:hypothetical protein